MAMSFRSRGGASIWLPTDDTKVAKKAYSSRGACRVEKETHWTAKGDERKRLAASGASTLRHAQAHSLTRRPDCVGHHRAAPAKRLFGTHCRIVRGLMLDLRVEFATEQNHDGGDPHP